MKVTTGLFKGKNIDLGDDDNVRPTIGRIREAVFNVIQFSIYGRVFVDLFSGSGSIGIEALSRGAKQVYFIDNSPTSIALINKNLQNVNAIKEGVGRFDVIYGDYKRAIGRIRAETADIIYCDPPYAADKIYDTLLLDLALITNDGGLVIIERDKELHISSEFFRLEQIRHYGTVYVHFYRKIKSWVEK